jgi:hypothetical protein
MSLAVSGKPVGLIYADRCRGVNRLDKVTYIKFKSAILLTGRALTYLDRQKQQSTS